MCSAEGAFDLSAAALVASGAGEHELDAYLGRIDALCRRAQPHLAQAGDRERAESLFHWLWQTRPDRYLYHGNFRLTRALRAQLGETPGPVGNCLGLTLLYNVLAQRLGLKVRACHLEEAFGRGPHVFSVVDTADGPIDVENIFPDGFDYRGHRDNPQRLIQSASQALSQLTRFAGVVMMPRLRAQTFRQLEFLRLSEKRILLIVVTPEGDVQNRVLFTERDYTATELIEAAKRRLKSEE